VVAEALAARVERLLSKDLTAKALRVQVLAEVRREIPFDAHVWLLTDPVTRVGTSPLADVPGMAWDELPLLGRLRYTSRTSRWSDLVDDARSCALLHEETAGDLARSSLWERWMRAYGVADVASLVFWDRYGCWAWLDLWRKGGTFTSAEAEALRSLVPLVTRGLREAQARTFLTTSTPVEIGGPAVVVLDPRLHVASRTTWAAEALERLNPPDEPMAAVPAAVYNVAAALLAQEDGVPVGPPWSRVHLGSGRWVTLRAARMDGEPEEEPGVVVTLEPTTVDERREVFALAHGLSPREREVLDALASGADTAAVAASLFVSEHTVHDHVKAVLAKTGTASRQALLARATGARATS
jgi:DNA-binding CsgD family transcriptional regulator